MEKSNSAEPDERPVGCAEIAPTPADTAWKNYADAYDYAFGITGCQRIGFASAEAPWSLQFEAGHVSLGIHYTPGQQISRTWFLSNQRQVAAGGTVPTTGRVQEIVRATF